MWTDFKDLWQYVNPQSLQIDFMQEALLSGQVWVGFDHVARLVDAFKQKPNDFIGVPAPKGPKGLYYMSVLAGLGIPKSSPNKAAAEAFIDYMTQPEVQGKTLDAVAFFPVLDKPLPANLAPHLKIESDAVQAQSKSPDAKVALLPIGLGAKGGEFNKVQLDTFQDHRQRRGHPEGPERAGRDPADRHERREGTLLASGPDEHGTLPGQVI